jgi:hypothetical protein
MAYVPPHLRNGGGGKGKGKGMGHADGREGYSSDRVSVRESGGRGKGRELRPTHHFGDRVTERAGQRFGWNVSCQ